MLMQSGKEIAIVVFVASEELMLKLVSFVEEIMRKLCFPVSYAVVCIENEDDIGKLLSPFDPRVLIFDANLKFIKSKNEYNVLEIVYRLCLRHKESLALLRVREGKESPYYQGLDGSVKKRIFWCGNVDNKKRIEKVLVKAFG